MLLAVIAWSPRAEAREARLDIDISATRLSEAIAELSRETGVSIGARGALPAIPTPRVRGRMTLTAALDTLLAGSGLHARQVGATAWLIERDSETSAKSSSPLAGTARAPIGEGPPIIVTGIKRTVLLQDASVAVTVAKTSGTSEFGATDGTDHVVEQSEGLALTGLGPGRNRLFLRGVADSAFTGESQSTVAVVLDDARLTYSAPDPDIRLVDVARVEVLKGPQGSLYGTGALGGIYHVVSNPPDLANFTVTATLGGAAVAHGESGESGSVVANLPLARDRAAVRFVAYAAREPGWVDTGPRQDTNSSDVVGARAALLFAPDESWRFGLSGLAQFLNSRDTGYVYGPGLRSRPDQVAEPQDNDLRHAAVRATRTGGPFDLLISTGATWHDIDDTLDATVGGASLGIPGAFRLRDERRYRVWDTEVRANGHLGRTSWLAGVSYLRARQGDEQTVETATGPIVAIDQEVRSANDAALFGNITVPLTSSLSLDAGARLFHSSIRETRRLNSGMSGQERDRTGLTPSAALVWRPRPRQTAYLRYGSAFRQGGIDVAPDGSFRDLKGDELATVEAGWRSSTDSGGRIELGAWFSWWENLQSDRLGFGGLIDTTNAGNARIAGVEGSVTRPLAPALTLVLGANLTSALLTRNDLGVHLDDRRLPVVPRYTLRGAIERRTTLGDAQLALRGALSYRGPSRLSFEPSIDRRFGEVFEGELSAALRIGRWRIDGRVDNVLGEARNVFAFGNPFRFSLGPQYTPQAPRRASVSVTTEF